MCIQFSVVFLCMCACASAYVYFCLCVLISVRVGTGRRMKLEDAQNVVINFGAFRKKIWWRV